MTRHLLRAACAALVLGIAAAPAGAQSLSRRVESAPDGPVQFTFPARAGVCGNGRSYIRTGPNSISGTFNGSVSETVNVDPCVEGPVRVVLDRAGRDVLSIETYVGPPQRDPAATDLGAVRAMDAADYLLSIAEHGEGRGARDALMPATLADGVDVTDRLISIARDQSRPREVRRSAMSWTVRGTADEPTISTGVTRALLDVARDDSDNQEVRRSALSAMSRLPHGAGVPPLIELARSAEGGWLPREAMTVLARSGDPRARDFLRAIVRRADLSDDVLARAVRGLGTEYATGRDAALLRETFPRLDGEKSREAVLQSIAAVGGSDNARWLVMLARDESQSLATRRRALQYATRAGVPTAELIGLYDTTTDPQMKEALISLYAQSGERTAVDKLMAIAKAEPNATLRRRTISQLSRSEDPRVRDFLRALVER